MGIQSPAQAGDRPFLNTSQIVEWNRCRYRWHLGAVRQIHPYSSDRRLDRGSAIHKGVERAFAAFAGGVTRIDLLTAHADHAVVEWDAEQRASRTKYGVVSEEDGLTLAEIRETATAVCRRFIRTFEWDRYEPLVWHGTPVLETTFRTEFPYPLNKVWGGFQGTVDIGLTEKVTGLRLLVDWKSRKQFTPVDDEDVNLQFMAYQKLMADNGVPVHGTLMVQLRAASPRVPSINKNGSISRTLIITDWDTYRDAVLAQGQDPNDYLDMKEKLAQIEFHRYTRTFRSMDTVESAWRDIIIPTAHSMGRERKKRGSQYRNLNAWNCKGCRYREFCLAELRGDDTEFLLETSFIDLQNPAKRVALRPEHVIMEDDDGEETTD